MKHSSLNLALGLGLALTFAVPAFADESFKKEHPRRAEVLHRAKKEEDKNNAAAVQGKITDKQARKLDRQDQRIKKEEQAQAKANGGFITKKEQAKDNRQENRVNEERSNMEKRDASGGPSSGGPTTPPGN